MTSSLSPKTEIHGSYKQIKNTAAISNYVSHFLFFSFFQHTGRARQQQSKQGKGTRCLCVPLRCGTDRREKGRRVSGHLRGQKGQEEEEEKRRGNVGKGRIKLFELPSHSLRLHSSRPFQTQHTFSRVSQRKTEGWKNSLEGWKFMN